MFCMKYYTKMYNIIMYVCMVLCMQFVIYERITDEYVVIA